MRIIKKIVFVLAGLFLLYLLANRCFHEVFKNFYVHADFGKNGKGFVLTDHGSICYRESYDDRVYDIVIPYGCTDYGYNENWIIAKTLTHTGYHKTKPKEYSDYNQHDFDSISSLEPTIVDYWIIDNCNPINTDTANCNFFVDGDYYYIPCKSCHGPLDSTAFLNLMKEFNITLEFSNKTTDWPL